MIFSKNFKLLIVSTILAALGCLPQTTLAQNGNTRTYSNEFLSLGVGARALAMGNAQAASVNDVTASYWNPAGLNQLNRLQVAAMHAEWFAGISKYDYIGIAAPIDNGKRAIGFTAIRFGIDDIPNTLFVVAPDGSINYDNITKFSAADYAFLLSYGQNWKKVRLGANAKIIHRRVGKFATAWGMGLDLGLQYMPTSKFTLGATLKDFPVTYNTWKYSFTEEEKQALALTDNIIPRSSVEITGQKLVLGAAYQFSIGQKIHLLSELNFNFTFDGKRNTLIKSDFTSIDPTFGLELNYDQIVFLRGGINNIQQLTNNSGEKVTALQPNAGIGVRIKELQIDYALTGLNRLSDGIYSHVISLKIDFGKKK